MTQVLNKFFLKVWSHLVWRHLFDLLLWPIFRSSFTHITHYKSCWTFCVGSYTWYQPYARAPNTYWNYIFVFKFEQSSYFFSLKNSRPCRDLNPGTPRYQADMLPIELFSEQVCYSKSVSKWIFLSCLLSLFSIGCRSMNI